MNLYENISKRKSNRRFSKDRLNDSVIKSIKRFMNSIPILNPDLNLAAHFIIEGDALYKKLPKLVRVRAPHYLIITGEASKENFVNAGYAMEHMVLFLTSIGIGTCYQGARIKTSALRSMIHCDDKDETLAIIALGNTVNPLEIYRKSDEVKRIPLEKMLLNQSTDPDITFVLNAARLAPSGFNSQCCRYAVTKGKIDIFLCENDMVRKLLFANNLYVDAGIALSHIKIAALERGHEYNISYNKAQKSKLEYVVSIEIL